MRRKSIFLLLFIFISINGYSQISEAEKVIWKFRYSKTLKKVLKHPHKAKEVYISNYTDSVFPNEDILKLLNIEQIVVFAKNVLKKQKSDSLSKPVTIKIDTTKLKQLPRLKYLTFAYFDFRKFPVELCYMRNLKVLNLSVCLIDSLPNEIENMSSLQALSLRLNNLTKLPYSIIHLDNLSYIDLANNSFKSFPNVLCEMKSLKKINLANPEGVQEIPIYHWSWPFPFHTNEIDYLKITELLKKLLLKSSIERVYLMTDTKSIKLEIEEKINSKIIFRKTHWQKLDN